MVCNLAHNVLYGQEDYQGLGVKNSFFLQKFIHVIAFFNETMCNSSTGELLRVNAEAFWVEVGIPLFLTSNLYEDNTFAFIYLPVGITLWQFSSNILYKLDISEDYLDLPLLWVNDVHLIQTFVNSFFRGACLKCLHFVSKYIQAVVLTDIATGPLTVTWSLISLLWLMQAMVYVAILTGQKFYHLYHMHSLFSCKGLSPKLQLHAFLLSPSWFISWRLGQSKCWWQVGVVDHSIGQ